MPLIHLFNPENDLALAQGNRNYTPPPNAMALHTAGATLPMWYGNDNDVFITNDTNIKWIEHTKHALGINIDIYDPSKHKTGYWPAPWGWSHDAARQFAKAGVPVEKIMPTEHIDNLRMLSHRRTTINVIKSLKETLPFELPTTPAEIHTAEDVIHYRNKHNGCYIKAPWSSSGRGVADVSSMPDAELHRRAEGIIHRQGSILCEAVLDKVEDFAMLFYSDGTSVKFVGYSAFFTEHGAAYTGNIVTSDDNIRRKLATYVNPDHLDMVSASLEDILTTTLLPHYIGYLGVDMMIYKSNDKMLIAPCVEINMRMTMGILAWHLYRKHLHNDSTAIMRVEFDRCSATRREPTIENGRLLDGTLSLIPPHSKFNITIEMIKSKVF
ncbi:MAG: hypothetical protein IJY30_06870 [Muribaculaceae bacterium]|nr:hypothetical protein [Muribaculaceae bacterium]